MASCARNELVCRAANVQYSTHANTIDHSPLQRSVASDPKSLEGTTVCLEGMLQPSS